MNRRLTAILATFTLLVTASIAVSAASEKTTARSAPPKTVTLELTDTTVVEAVESLFKGTNLSYILQPGVGGTISSLRLRDMTFDKALNALVKAAGLEVNLEEGVYIIGKPAEAAAAKPAADTSKPAADGTQADVEPSNQPNYQPDQMGMMPGQNPQMPMGMTPDQYPVYYGNIPPQGYQGYQGYNQGYNGYGPYGYNYPPVQVYVPAYSYQSRSMMLPGPGSIWSAPIGGRIRITPPINNNLITPR